jgi:signal transduction histidine kinase
MNTKDMKELSQILEKAFEATLTEYLIPGILHNFANPLNGIMGRAQILQRRLKDTLKRMGDQYPDVVAAFREPMNKLTSDVGSICQESDRFYNMFQDVSGKFYGAGATAPEMIDLSRLLVAELRFADYYLDFKHEVRKDLDIKESLPEIYGVPSYYSLCFWSLFRHAVESMRLESDKTLHIAMTADGNHVVVALRYQGIPLTEEENRRIEQALSSDREDPSVLSVSVSHVYQTLHLLRRMGAHVDYGEKGGLHEIVIKVSIDVGNRQ